MTRTYGALDLAFPDRGHWDLPSILRERARTHPTGVFIDSRHQQLQLTYAETLQAAERIAANLVELGGRPGDRVLVMGANSAEHLLTWFGAALAGMVHVPINTAYSGNFLEHQIAVSRPRFAVVDADLLKRFESSAAAAHIQGWFVLGDAPMAPPSGSGSVAPFANLQRRRKAALPAVSPRDLCAIFFTSGTTGASKGVMMPQSQVAFFAQECVSMTRLSDTDVYMGVGPLFHGNTAFLAAIPALVAGARFALYDRFSASHWSGWVAESGATVTNLVGVMMDFVWRQPPEDGDARNRLRCVRAAPTAWSFVDAFKARFGIEAVLEAYGLTETSSVTLTPYDADRPPGSCGLLADEAFEARLVDPETDLDVAPGAVGELVVRPRLPWTTTIGYYGMPEATAVMFRNLWLHTGDGLRRDEEGWFYFVDRLKDAIRRRGENISSYEIEQALLAHEDVEEVAVIGIPADQEAGEDEVMAYIVVARGAHVDPEELWRWSQSQVPAFAVPRYVRVVEELPKTPSHKVRKTVLRQMAQADRGSEFTPLRRS